LGWRHITSSPASRQRSRRYARFPPLQVDPDVHRIRIGRPSTGQMTNDPILDVCHHDFLVDVIEEIVKVSVVQLQRLVL
jgi:hypothetical protein